ncbi:MAG: hypothetical protein NTV26_04090 [Caldiserica bacterium]|nr:hypothetical protein [Caldisericota bacterium]
MRTAVRQVHQWTTPDSGNPRRRKIEKWLFGAMFLWPVILLACDVVAKGMHSESPYYMAAYIGSPLYAAMLIVTALCEYPASRRFLQWLAGIILVIATYWGVAYYFDSLQHGWKWVESATKSPVVWLDGVLVVLSIIYLAVPQKAWVWLGNRVKLLWKRVRHGRST